MSAVIVTNNGFVIGGDHLEHSPKGTTWKDHKYIKKVNGRYVYPAAKSAIASKEEVPNSFANSGDAMRFPLELGKLDASISVKLAQNEYKRRQARAREISRKAEAMGQKAIMSILGYDKIPYTEAWDPKNGFQDIWQNRKDESKKKTTKQKR